MIVYVVKRFPKFSETFVLRELEELIRQGEDVVVFSLERPHAGEPSHDGADEIVARTRYLPRGPARLLALGSAALAALVRSPRRAWPALAWSLRWALRDRALHHLRRFGEAAYLAPRLPRGARHVHAHFAHGATSVALLLGRLTERPFSFTGHAKDIFQLVSPRLLADKAAEARFVVAISEHGRRHIQAALPPEGRGKVVLVRNGVERARFSPRAAEPDGAPLVLSVSRLVRKKGLDTLIDACARLQARGVDFRCEVIGEGPMRAKLERRLGRRGLDGRVALIGSRDQATVREAYDRATVFVLPSRRTPKGDQDGLPVSLVEAMAVGVPVVSTPVGGIPEVVRDDETGILVPPDDADTLARELERILARRDLRTRLAARAQAVAAEYDLHRSVERLRALFAGGPNTP